MKQHLRRNLAFLTTLTVLAASATASPPSVPKTKLKHKEEFIDRDTKERRRMVKNDYLVGAESWDGKKKRYVRHGVFLTLRSDGSVSESTTYHYGIRHGQYQEWNRKGVLKRDGYYEYARKSGEWLTYTDKGKLFAQDQYKDGRKHGRCVEYDTSAKSDRHVQFVTHFKEGRRHGPFEQHNSKGKKVVWGNYVDGKKHGTWFEYDWNDKRRSKEWVNGKPVK
jgi:antitoxin component YwqK of YwqJK toxin-antitoxin module